MPTYSPARQTLLLLLLALAVLAPGIWEATGLTGKDEFFLGLRTPMEMIEGNHWLVPFLDGAPRIRKSQNVTMFDGPQPAMLPILRRQAHRRAQNYR